MTLHAAGAPLPVSYGTRVTLVFVGMLQITLAAGLIIGWAGIAGSMLIAPEEAGLTLDQTTMLYGLAASVNYISPLFLGLILDKAGPRACSCFSNGVVALGCFVFAHAPTGSLQVFAMGTCLMAFGGPGVQTSLMHTGNMFPERRFFVMGCVAESITLSFAVLPVMDVIWEATDWSLREIFQGLAVLVALSAVTSFFIWPDAPYEVREERDGHLSEREVCREEALEVDLTLSQRQVSKPGEEGTLYTTNTTATVVVPLKDRTFTEQLTSGVYLRLSLFFLVTSWWANFYIATVTTELGDQQLFDVGQQHELARLLSFIDAGAIVCAPVSWYLLDSVGFTPTAVITICLGILQQVCLLIAGNNETIMTASFVLYAVFRAFLFPYYFASLSKKIGFRYFGVLSGLSFSTSGLSQLTIAPVALWIEGTCHDAEDDIATTTCSEGRWAMIHMVEMGCLLLLFLIPVVDVWSAREEQRKMVNATLDASGTSSKGTKQSYGSISTDDEAGEGDKLLSANVY